jgi:hypothetical protein
MAAPVSAKASDGPIKATPFDDAARCMAAALPITPHPMTIYVKSIAI